MGLLSDERLARRAAQGDRRAFEAIYRRYGQSLYRFCLAVVGNREDAQDALQNTMVKVLAALPGEERTIRLKPWLYRIARNEAAEVLRRRREGGELDPNLEAAGDVAARAEARERLRDLLGDLELLPERQRSVLLMRELSGLGFAEIGEALGTSAAVARQTLYEARLGLRQLQRGREMRCAEVTRELSDGDGRIARRREIRSHLRSCASCRGFREEIETRSRDLAAISPLPLGLAAALLKGALGAGGSAATVTTSAAVKTAATIAVATVVGVSAADRGGLVDLPLPAKERGSAVREAPRQGEASAPVGVAPPGGLAGFRPVAGAGRGARKPAVAGAVGVRRGLRPAPVSEVPVPPSAVPLPGARPAAPEASPAAIGSAAAEAGPASGHGQTSAHGQQTAAAKRPAQAGGPAAQGPAKAAQGKADPNEKGGQGEKAPEPERPAPTPSAAGPPDQAQPGPPPHVHSPAADGVAGQSPGKDEHEQTSSGGQASAKAP